MARLALNKSALHRERARLRRYERFLPSLDLKRKQLMAELARAKRTRAARREEIAALRDEVARRVPMLAFQPVDLSGLVRVGEVRLAEENRLGVRLPVLEDVICELQPYSMLARPHWVDPLVGMLRRMAELRLGLEVAEERVRRLGQAVRRITQRVNLFEQRLIPEARRNIQRIEIALADAERAAVVRAKIAKARHQGADGPAGRAGG